MNHLGGVGWEMWCMRGRASKLAGKRLTEPARLEAPGSWKRCELLQAEEVQLSLKDHRHSAHLPRCSGSIAIPLQPPPVLTPYNLERLRFLARGEVLVGVTSPLTFPERHSGNAHCSLGTIS